MRAKPEVCAASVLVAGLLFFRERTLTGNPFVGLNIVLPGKNLKSLMFVSWLWTLCVAMPVQAATEEERARLFAETPFHVQGSSAILGDIDSGAVLVAQKEHMPIPPASLTKIMTLYLLYDALKRGELTLDTKLPVSEKAWRTGGSKTFVRVGDNIRVEDLIRGIAVQSGNDACVVVAEHLAGSEEGFAQLMNRKAKELGMTRTHFENATGLPGPSHLTTSWDLFLMAQAILRDFPNYTHYFQEKQYAFEGIRQYNRNRLLWRDASITGLKTGHTKEAGYCMIASNDKDGQRLVAVITGAKSSRVREEEALRLLRYGERVFKTVRLFEAGSKVRTLRVWKGNVDFVDGIIEDALFVTVPRKDHGSLEVGIAYHEPLVAPMAQGDKIGRVVVKLGEKEITTRPVLAKTEVLSGGTLRVMLDAVRMYLGW